MGARERRASRAGLLVLMMALQPFAATAQLSKPVAHDSNMGDTSGNKFLQREANLDVHINTGEHEEADEVLEDVCPMNIAIKWHAEASSSVYATPLITDLFSDGRKDIIVPSFSHNVEVFEGRDGAKVPDFQASHASTVHTSPLLYDIDLDGVPDIVVATYDGDILFFKDTGEEAAQRLTVPRLRVRRDWHKGLDPDHVDHTKPDVGLGNKPTPRSPPAPQVPDAQQAQQAQQQAQQGGEGQGQRRRRLLEVEPALADAGLAAAAASASQAGGGEEVQHEAGEGWHRRRLAQDAQQGEQQAQQAQQGQEQGQEQGQGQQAQQQEQQAQQGGEAAQQAQHDQEAKQAQQAQQHEEPGEQHGKGVGVEEEEVISDEAADSFNELFGEGDAEEGEGEEGLIGEEEGGDVAEGTAFRDVDDNTGGGGSAAAGGEGSRPHLPRKAAKKIWSGHRGKQERPHGFEGDDPAGLHDYDPDYAGDRAHAASWDDAWYEGSQHHAADAVGGKSEPAKSPYLYIDAHILATPAIADIDGDGAEELVVAVSYFYDLQYYDNEDHRRELGQDVELGQYVASGVVVFDLHRKTVKWSQHLDMSTDYTAFKAYAYSAPTLADLDQDGKMEVILGTSMGFLYVLDCYGVTRKGFPLQMGDIQAQVAVADVDNDGRLELVAGDARGNLAAFTADGTEVWEVHLESQVHQNPVFGDIDGDGQLEVVVTTFSGNVVVLRAATGGMVEPFPFKVFGKLMGAPLLTKLDDPKTPGMQIVVVGFDGFLYAIDGVSGCADSLDLGESSYGQVLADDLDGNGRLDLLVATTNGNIYAIATAAKYHPLLSWPQQTIGGGSFTARWGWEGVYVTTESRQPRDVRGQLLPLRFKIIDRRPPVKGALDAEVAAQQAKQGKAAAGGKYADEDGPAGGNGGGKKKAPAGRGPYKVSIQLTGVGTKEMNSGERPIIGMADVINGTGAYTMEIPCPRSRATATVRVEMRDETRLLFVDEFSLSFHVHFYRLLKWIIAGPFLAAGIALLAFRQDAEALPA